MVKVSVAALSAALLVMTAGCDKKPTGQSVAVVEGEEVSSAELNAELAAANVPPSADKKVVMPQLLQRVVDRKLLAQLAVEQGVDKTPEYLTRQRRLNEELLIGLYMKRRADAIKIPDQRAIDTYIAANPQMFGQRSMLALNQIVFDIPADPTVLNRMRDDHSLDDVARSLTELGIPFERRQGRLDTATAPKAMMDQINALPEGEPFVVPEGRKVIASVITARQQANAPTELNRRIAADALRKKQLGEQLDAQLKQLRTSAKIEYQPGYEPAKAGPATPAAKGKAAPKTS